MNHNQDYRAFRKTVLQACSTRESEARRGYLQELPHPIVAMRTRLAVYYGYLRFYAREMLRKNPADEPHIHRALGISQKLPLVPTKWTVAANVGLVFLPDRISVQRARRLLGMSRRLEGRTYIFEQFVRLSFPGYSGQWHYSASLDYILRQYEVTHLIDDLRDIQHLDVGLLKTGTLLGLRNIAQIKQFLMPKRSGIAGSLILLLVEEGVVQAPEELSWVHGGKREYYLPVLDAADYSRARQLVKALLANGVSRQLIAGVFASSIDQFNPDRLKGTLQLLLDAGLADLSAVFASVNELLWRSSTHRWQFLIDTVGVSQATEVEQFKLLLESHREVPPSMIFELKCLGADLPALASCLPMLLATARDDNSVPPVKELRLLSSQHGLTVADLTKCEKYLDSGRDLAGFLSVMNAHGFGSRVAVLAFQRCYGEVSGASLDRLLSIVGDRGHDASVEDIADWVLLAGKAGYYSSFEYLVTAIDMVGMISLQQSLKVSALGPALLRYLVEQQGLDSLKAIRDWYYNDAQGIQGYHAWGVYDELDKVLIDDAFNRKSFNLVEGNQRCIADALDDRIVSIVGVFPYEADEATKANHRSLRDEARRRERQALRLIMPLLLQRTGGMVLGSLLKAAWRDPAELAEQLNVMAPLLDDLLMGRGPTSTTLSELEEDAIALVYRTTVPTVRSTWAHLTGRERDLASLSLRDQYPMSWQRVQWQITRPLDRRGICALVSAAEFAGAIKACRKADLEALCKPLLSKRLAEPSADVTTLVHHLGVLLAAADGDSVVAKWRRSGFEDLTQIDEESLHAYQCVESLQTLFETELPDALDAAHDGFIRSFSDEDAALLAARLDKEVSQVAGADGLTQLRLALINTRKRVLAIYGKWVKRELAKFRREKKSSLAVLPVAAVATKHPAAFFAKETAKLCTRHNTEMWREDRHSHLVVFDPAGKCIVGMALLYVEVLPHISRTRPSIVIRAMNPTPEAMASYSVTSMVDAFFEVATRIAEDNGLACVAFPTDAGMHLLSNHQAVEKDIKTRFVKRSSRSGLLRNDDGAQANASSLRVQPIRYEGPFEAYEQGQNKVNGLYVIWQAESVAENRDVSHLYSLH